MSKGKDYRFLKSTLGKMAGDGLLQGNDDKLERGVQYNFLTGIVNDVISNPYTYLRKEIDGNNGEKITVGDILSGRKKAKGINVGIKNKDLIDTAPINSIIAQLIDPGTSSKDGALPVLCYPFFPPHMSLPLKPGEYVWLIECDVKGSKMYYWMCRQVGTIHVDDVNFTNMERIIAAGQAFDGFLSSNKAKKPADEILQRSTTLDNESESTNSNIGFNKIFANSNAFRSEFTGEPVPRMVKGCSDLLFQGSNNSGIHLTTEKFSDNVDTDVINTKYSGKISEDDSLPTRKPDSSAIDIFVKRKKSDLDKLTEEGDAEKYSAINTIKNKCGNDLYTYLENDKMAILRYQDDSVHDKELIDVKADAIDVGARVYLSHKCDVDKTFLIDIDDLANDAKMGPSIVTFSNHNRIIGEQDVRLVSRVGQSFINIDSEGNIVIKAAKGGAYISLKKDGSIAIVPGTDGLLYLGGDEGDALNAALVQTGLNKGGTVEGLKITSTFGGVVGIDPQEVTGPAGKFTSKVMFR
tara:strand:+ start:303 stop:1868 length:1566 start_codon:yes stop_codon:yes gene_type:complete